MPDWVRSTWQASPDHPVWWHCAGIPIRYPPAEFWRQSLPWVLMTGLLLSPVLVRSGDRAATAVPPQRVILTPSSQVTMTSDLARRFQPPPTTNKLESADARSNVTELAGIPGNRGNGQQSNALAKDLRLLRVRALVKGGALRLAITTLDRFQQGTTSVADWWLLEQERLQILNLLRDWQAIVERTTQVRAELPPKVKEARNDWLAMARLKLHQGDKARRVLRTLLWSTNTPRAAFQSSWRRKIIRSYLVAGHFQDAKTAALRYQQEFLPTDPAWTYLFARVLLAANDPQLALQWLRANQTFEGRLLRLQAQLMVGSKPAVVQADAQQLMTSLPVNALGLRRELWTVIAAAADRAGDYLGQLRAMEQALNIPPQPADYLLAKPTVEALIKVLLKTGEQLGNQANLILGEDGPWMELARSNIEQYPLRAQSLFAVLVRQGEAEFTRRRAHEALIELLFKADRKLVAVQLYADSNWLPAVAVLSDSSRYLLAETDMRQGKIAQAADLVKNLVRPPNGVDPLDWVLRRARLAVYAGDTATSKRLIGDYLQPLTLIGEGAARRIEQVLFDLQSVGAHRLALQLFRSLRDRIEAPKLQREILFWMGDSWAALREYRRAAELYLSSALAGDNSFDLWGQSARYKAADVLVKSGLVEDARRLYKSLLRATADTKRRSQLQRRLQELWLRKTT